MASQITSLTIVYSTVYSNEDKKTSKHRVTGLCTGNSPVTGEFPAQMASNTANVSFMWRHHGHDYNHGVKWCLYKMQFRHRVTTIKQTTFIRSRKVRRPVTYWFFFFSGSTSQCHNSSMGLPSATGGQEGPIDTIHCFEYLRYMRMDAWNRFLN